jgi:hypothetical protein
MMKNKFLLLKLLFHWILCQMLSQGISRVECSSGIFKDFSSGKWSGIYAEKKIQNWNFNFF